MKGFITNLRAYNDGFIIGKWLDFPVTDAALEEAKKSIHLEKDGEFFFTDWDEIGPNVSKHLNEYPNLELYNKLAEMNENEYEYDVIETLASDLELEETIDVVKDEKFRVYPGCETMAEVAMEIAKEGGYLDNIPQEVKLHIDYEAWGEDLEINGVFCYDRKNRCYIEIMQY